MSIARVQPGIAVSRPARRSAGATAACMRSGQASMPDARYDAAKTGGVETPAPEGSWT